MKAKNHNLYSDVPGTLDRWEEEYRYLGRHVKRTKEGLVVFALAPKPVKKKTEKRGPQRETRQNKENGNG